MLSCLKQGKAFYANLIALAIPIILQNLITNSLGLLDTFMVGMLAKPPWPPSPWPTSPSSSFS